ncbi:hypothetical protein [Heyndrickxia oleronia]|nr:hypothetical protein [Heyndrickxia oleronia]
MKKPLLLAFLGFAIIFEIPYFFYNQWYGLSGRQIGEQYFRLLSMY